MLEYLKLINFQVHKILEVYFSPNITTIIGQTDSGKSSIIRGLKWLTFNKPRRKEFISWDKELCIAKLGIDNHLIIRKVSKGINLYKLNEKVFKAFGSDVPIQIQSLLNISDLNFQYQLDPIFWFMETAGFIGKELNSIINLEIIDESLGNVGTMLRQCKSHIEIIESRIESNNRELESLLWVKQFDMDLLALESLNERIKKEASRIASAEKAILTLNKATELVKTASKALPFAEGLLEYSKELLEQQKRIDSIKELLDQIKSNEYSIQCFSITLQANQKELETKFPNCPICGNPLLMPNRKKLV